MDYKNYIETGLYELLGRFVDKNYLTHEVINRTENYLFKNESLPFFKNTELFETIVYLKDLMKINDLITFEDILTYYEKERNETKAYLNKMFSKDELCSFSELLPLEFKALNLNDVDLQYNLMPLKSNRLIEIDKILAEEETDATIPE